jgi:hypothetical protein
MEPDTLPFGAGSGGDDTSDKSVSVDGIYEIDARKVKLMARPPLPPATSSNPCCISILAAGTGDDAYVDIRGSKGVRVTTGPPPVPPMSSDSTDGVEIIVSELQNVSIQRGLIEGVDQRIDMTPGSIVVDGGAGSITLKSLTNISLSVAGGMSSITLTPAGIIIQGLIVKIN